MTRLRLLAQYCEFDDLERRLVDHVVSTCISNEFRRKLLRQDDLDLQDLLEFGRIHDTEDTQAPLLDSNAHRQSPQTNDSINAVNNRNKKNFKCKKCFNCGNKYPHESSICPAKGKTCKKCKKPNNFAKVCKTKMTDKTRKEKVNCVNDCVDDSDSCSDNEIQTIFAIETKTGRKKKKARYVDLSLLNTQMIFKIDTEAEINIIDSNNF